jgi:transposase
MSQRKSQKKPTTKQTQPRDYTAKGPLPVARKQLSQGVKLDAHTEVERQKRMEGLKASLLQAIAAGRAETAVDQVIVAMLELERENERLAWRVLRANRHRFGRNTEKLSREELEQLNAALGGDSSANGPSGEPSIPTPAAPEQVDDAGAVSDEQEPPPDAPEAKGKKKKRKRVHSMRVGPEVERKTTVIPLPDDELHCALCGRAKHVFDYVDHETFRYIPGKIVVDVVRRPKAGCGHCRKDISVAPRPQAPAVVRNVDASLLAKLVTDKCILGLPLDRQRREIARLGLDIPDKTIQSYWAYTTDLIEPIATATQSLTFGQAIVGVDDTGLRTLDSSAKPGVFRGHLWCFVGDKGGPGAKPVVAYGYTESWEADQIVDWFSAIDGFIQCDGYAGYSAEVEDEDGTIRIPVPDERRLGCGMHIRSKFHAALLAKDRRAGVPLKHFADLYQIEQDCKHRALAWISTDAN